MNTDKFLCSWKCEVKTLPFNETIDDDFKNIYDHRSFNFRHGYKLVANKGSNNRYPSKLIEGSNDLTSSSEVFCDYLNPNNISDVLDVNNDVNCLSLFHCNVASLHKNLDRIEELFHNCSVLPSIIAVTETKLKINSPEINLEGYTFEDCRTTTNAGGAGIYISEGTNYTVRNNISIQLDRCEEKWIEIVFLIITLLCM